MTSEIVEQAIVRAVSQAYDDWSVEHPSLSAVIDSIAVTERTCESLRESQEFRRAVEAYHHSRSELELLDRLTELAGPIVRGLLAS